MHFDPAVQTAVHLYESLDTPRSLTCLLLVRSGEWDQLASLAIDPAMYLDVPSGIAKYRADAQATAFLRKYEDLRTSFDKKLAAEESFLRGELQCAETNYKLGFLSIPPAVSDGLAGVREIISRAQKIIARILGPLPDSLEVAFGPGTSFELKGSTYSTVMDKLCATPHVTPLCRDVFLHYYWASHWGRSKLEFDRPLPLPCRGNRFTTVAKDGKTDRGICIEPLGNLSCQLSIGRYLKRRLADVGLYVDRSNRPDCPLASLTSVASPEGQDVHNKCARQASVSGSHATIDLTLASDTIAYQLVRALLPPLWFRLLDSCRSPFTLFKGRWVRLEKFSSMGNGFTFELETLIFAALASAACDARIGHDLLVYGDDIICPVGGAPMVIRVLEMFGFIPNRSKTFVTGSFRESCGGDYFSGVAVRPVFLKKVRSHPCDWIALHNELFRWSGSFPTLGMSRALRHIRGQVPVYLRFPGPSGLGDNLFHTRFGKPKFRWEHGIRYWRTVRSVSDSLPLDRWSADVCFTAALLGVPSQGVVPRNSERGIATGWSAFS